MWRWSDPRPDKPKKTKAQLEKERQKKVQSFLKDGVLKSQLITEAMLRVPREEFVPPEYRDHCYREVPLPLPALEATVSCPRSYVVFYEALQLRNGDRFLEVGTGSGYGAALAREVVGREGLVVSLEIDRSAYSYARSNLTRLGYDDIILIRGDGCLGYEPEAPYDKISVTAALLSMPQTLLDQLKDDGLAVAPMGNTETQELKLIHKDGTTSTISHSTAFVPMVGRYRGTA